VYGDAYQGSGMNSGGRRSAARNQRDQMGVRGGRNIGCVLACSRGTRAIAPASISNA